MSTTNQPERKKFRVTVEDKDTGERLKLIVMATNVDEATNALAGSILGYDCQYRWIGSGPEYDDPKPTVMPNVDGRFFELQSDEGFYIGDICYALNDEVYRKVWGGSGWADGEHIEPVTGRKFAVGRTYYGDGEYKDNEGHLYGVDAGNIGIVPKELCKDTEGGFYYKCPGTALFSASVGEFVIYLPDGKCIEIDTTVYADEEESEEE